MAESRYLHEAKFYCSAIANKRNCRLKRIKHLYAPHLTCIYLYTERVSFYGQPFIHISDIPSGMRFSFYRPSKMSYWR